MDYLFIKINCGVWPLFYLGWYGFLSQHYLTCIHLGDKPSGLRSSGQQCLEITLSQIYILRNPNNLAYTLSAYALDGGPLKADLGEPERAKYRFMMHDWEKTIRGLLANNSIPFEVVKTFSVNVCCTPSKKKVYVAEEELEVLSAINVTLEDAGYDVFLSHCAKPLMEDSLPPIDLFIFDKAFKDGDGLEIYHHLRSRPESQHTPVIMISSTPHFSETIDLDVNDFLQKPFEMQDLLTMVTKYTGPPPSS